jgi:hypothetical protein
MFKKDTINETMYALAKLLSRQMTNTSALSNSLPLLHPQTP